MLADGAAEQETERKQSSINKKKVLIILKKSLKNITRFHKILQISQNFANTHPYRPRSKGPILSLVTRL